MKPCGFSEQLLDAWEGSENKDRLGLSLPALLRQTRQSIDDFLLLSFSLLHFVVQPAKLTSPPPPPPSPSLPSTDITDFSPPCPLSFCVFLMDSSGLMPGQTNSLVCLYVF